MNVDHLPSDEVHPHVLRVGWSADDTSMQLGEWPSFNCFVFVCVCKIGILKNKCNWIFSSIELLTHLTMDLISSLLSNDDVLIILKVSVLFIRRNFVLVCAGEEQLSFGYGGTGKASTECQFKDFGETFTAGDVMTAYAVSSLFTLRSLFFELVTFALSFIYFLLSTVDRGDAKL